ncbi:MAG: hypothetical protein CVT89_07685 [Candidatus Altiarchaeales archaeon HGW-Altiarchaeales-2]|nr:MAG: hypothetical protein CVT89_07685 [Candidatus Altiarchaeales archaeon HGW-Altiarchaeales-2]
MYETEIHVKFLCLPDNIKADVLDYIDFLISKYHCKAAKAKGFKFDWEGGLADIKEKLSSVELQHKSSEWR